MSHKNDDKDVCCSDFLFPAISIIPSITVVVLNVPLNRVKFFYLHTKMKDLYVLRPSELYFHALILLFLFLPDSFS